MGTFERLAEEQIATVWGRLEGAQRALELGHIPGCASEIAGALKELEVLRGLVRVLPS
jgi:hypothetical protein